MENASTSAQISDTGLLTATRSIIIYAFCTLTTSVVMRVTRLFVENLSMFEKEKSWIRSNMALRRFFDKPEADLTDSQPQAAPNTSASAAISKRANP